MNSASKIALLENRHVMRLVGPDRFTFLQGLISQDIAIAEQGKPLFTAFLTPQGKYLADFFVIPDKESLLIDCNAAQSDDLAKRLAFYRMRAQVALEDTRNHFSVFGIWGAPSNHPSAFIDPRTNLLGERLVINREDAAHISPNREGDDYLEHRYSCGVPEGSNEIEQGQATLLEINFDVLNAISWSKGCYMGQELTARTHYRGLIKKRYLPFRYEGAQPERHIDIYYEGFAIGQAMAVAREYGLGLFNIEKIKPIVERQEMIVHNGTSLMVNAPDYLKSKINI